VKRFLVHLAVVGALLVEGAAEEVIDLNSITCRQLLELKPERILIVIGWLQGYYLDEHAQPIVNFDKASIDRRKLTERCEALPEEDVMTAAEKLFWK
jgi:acid stress chaperone HdeB